MKTKIFFHILLLFAIVILCGCKEKMVHINYMLDGGVNDERNIGDYCPRDLPIKLYSPTKENYEFLGWYLDNSFTDNPIETIEESYENITLYAKWSLNQITSEMIDEVMNWINNYLEKEIKNEVKGNIELITKDPLYNLDIIWESSNHTVLTNGGIYLAPKVDTHITLNYTIIIDAFEPISSSYDIMVLHDESISRADNLIFENYTNYQESEVYEARYSVTISINDEKLGSVDYNDCVENFYGEKIIVEANEIGRFLFWIENNRIVSKEKIYQFLVTENHALVAYFVPMDKCAIVFLDVNDEIIDIVLADKGEYVSTDKHISNKMGFTFIGFDSIKAIDEVHYQYAVYEANQNQCLVKVKYGYFPGEEDKYKYVFFGEKIIVNCDDSNFSYWMIDNNVVSYEREYCLTILKQEIELVAIIEGKNSKKFCANLFNITEINDELLIFGSFSNPNNLPIIEVGLIISFGEENSNLKVASWTEASKIQISNISSNHEFALLYQIEEENIINVCVYVVTNNGTVENPVYIYHYSQVNTYNYLSDR